MEKAQLKIVQEAQKAHPVLTTYIKLTKAELTHRGMQVSPQGILYKVMDGEQLMMVPHELHQKILVENHDVPTTRHVGINRTVDLIKWNYWWRGIWGDVVAYVRSCLVCQCMKSDSRKKACEMQPIPLLEKAWQQITTDLVTDLPESDGKTAIAVFVDRLNKMTHMVPLPKK